MESRPVLEGRDCLMSSGETEVALRVSGLVVSLTAIYEEIMETFLNKVPEGYEPKELVRCYSSCNFDPLSRGIGVQK
jgi:hypothetical protein